MKERKEKCRECANLADLDYRFKFAICFDCVEKQYGYIWVSPTVFGEDLVLGKVFVIGEDYYEWFSNQELAAQACSQRNALFENHDWVCVHSLNDGFDGWHIENYGVKTYGE